MQIVTLTTDWGTKDFFAGMVKGRLYSGISNVQVVDITHDIEPYNLISTAFIVKNACLNYPKGTIHIIDVNSVESEGKDSRTGEVLTDNRFVIVEYNEQYYVCTDNKMPHAVFGEKYTSITEINVYWDSNFYTFAAYDLFCKVVIMIANGTPLEKIGYKRENLNPSVALSCICHPDSVIAYIMYIDSYGNGYLNITYEKFMEVSKNRNFTLIVQNEETSGKDVMCSYDDVPKNGALLLTVSATGYLQIAMKLASAEQLLNLKVRDKVMITFQNK